MKIIVSLLLMILLALYSCKQSPPQSLPNQPLSELPSSENKVNVAAESEDRYAWQKPELVIDQLGNIDGKVIADIGAGTGYFAFRLMRKADRVIAVDIDADMLELINIFRANLDSLDQRKIETRQASAESANLMLSEVDIAFIVNTIGYIEDKSAYLTDLRRSLKDGGELMIVDFKMKRIPDNIAPPIDYRVSLLALEDLLVDAGYTQIKVDDRTLEYQYIVKATKE